MTQTLTGGCFCGAIRYQISGEPALQVMCYCTDCLKITGTSGFAGYMVNSNEFQCTQGEPTTHLKTSKEGRTVTRHFCPTCGSNLWGVTEFDLISVAAGTLDEPSQFEPTTHVFTEQAVPWARLPADS